MRNENPLIPSFAYPQKMKRVCGNGEKEAFPRIKIRRVDNNNNKAAAAVAPRSGCSPIVDFHINPIQKTMKGVS